MKKDTISFGLSTILVSLILTSILFQSINAMAQDGSYGRFEGSIFNPYYNRPFVGAEIEVRNDYTGYIEKKEVSDQGIFSFYIPSGTYNVTISYQNKILQGPFMVMVTPNTVIHRDITINYSLSNDALVYGYIYSGKGQLLTKKLRVNFTGVSAPYWNDTITDENGRYEIQLPHGIYNITVYDGTRTIYHGTNIPIKGGEQWYNITLSKEIEPLTLGDLWRFIYANIYYVVAIIAFIIIFAFIYGYLTSFLKKLSDKYSQNLSPQIWTLSMRTIKVIYAFFVIYILIYVSGLISGVGKAEWFTYITIWYNAIFLIFIFFLIARIILITIANFVEKLRQRSVPRTTVLLVHITLKYITIITFFTIGIIILLSAFGLYEMIHASIIAFFTENLGYITLILILIALAYLSTRLIRTFMEDLKERETKYSPQMIDTIQKGISFIVYFIIALIIIFTLLSMAKMQEIGSTLLVILSTMLGLVVAMAATGSIGNILSGLVLQSMKPFEIGDRVQIGEDIIGDIEDTSLIFTTLRTLRNERVTVPNNVVLEGKIVNFSRSGIVAVEVSLSIGYDVPPEMVMKLLKKGIFATKGILRDPKPQILASEFKDYAIKYIIRAYTNKPKYIYAIKSRLISNIHNAFYEEGVEILSPWYIIKREEAKPVIKEVRERYATAMKHAEEGSITDMDSDEIQRAMTMFDSMNNGEGKEG